MKSRTSSIDAIDHRSAQAGGGGPEAVLFQAVGLLGGLHVLGRAVASQLDVHDMVLDGMPTKALDHLLDGLVIMRRDSLFDGALGMSLRTIQRHKDSGNRALNREQSGRTWKVAEILAKAIDVFGSRAEAEAWLERPAVGLDQRRPIDLLATISGTEIVEIFLSQVDHGVYM